MQPIDDSRADSRPRDGSPTASQGRPGDSGKAAHDSAGDSPPTPREPLPDLPPAGPHATPELTNEDATPGSGYLPQISPEDEADPAGG
jgi:hypothetical protein